MPEIGLTILHNEEELWSEYTWVVPAKGDLVRVYQRERIGEAALVMVGIVHAVEWSMEDHPCARVHLRRLHHPAEVGNLNEPSGYTYCDRLGRVQP